MGRDNDGRDEDVGALKVVLKLKPSHFGHVKIDHQTVRNRGAEGAYEFRCRAERLNIKGLSPKQPRQRIANGRFIIDD